MSSGSTSFDVLIIGGGPTGSTTALVLARAGVRVLVVEKTKFPRFHVGESFLPRNFDLIRDLGLLDKLRTMTHVPKYGAEFGLGHSLETTTFDFAEGLHAGRNETFNCARADFDSLLLTAATEAGATVWENQKVSRINRLADGDVEVLIDDEPVRAKYLLDASGQATVVGRHLKLREPIAGHRKVAFFGHFTGVKRLTGEAEGHPLIAMCDEGWFWAIPIDPLRTSIGFVLDADLAKRLDLPADEMLRWGISHCPLMADRTANATFPAQTNAIADFSYYCRPYAGPGYFLLGDAAFFLDPIFSTGICLGMMGGAYVAQDLVRVLKGELPPERARRRYTNYIEQGSSSFFKLVHMYYRHEFRELLLNFDAPLRINKAVISLLSGHVFPKPRFDVRWRVWLFRGIVRAQRFISLVPRRPRFSLLGHVEEHQRQRAESMKGS